MCLNTHSQEQAHGIALVQLFCDITIVTLNKIFPFYSKTLGLTNIFNFVLCEDNFSLEFLSILSVKEIINIEFYLELTNLMVINMCIYIYICIELTCPRIQRDRMALFSLPASPSRAGNTHIASSITNEYAPAF